MASSILGAYLRGGLAYKLQSGGSLIFGGGGGGVEAHVLYGGSRELKNKQQNNVPTPKNNATAGYKGPVGVKKELLKGAGLLSELVALDNYKKRHERV